MSLVDLAPTLLELGGFDRDSVLAAEMDGCSLAPLVQGARRAAEPRSPVICEYHAEGVLAPAAMIREGPLKLIVCESDPDQLFDLANDPQELVNLAGEPTYAGDVARLRLELERRLDLAAIGERVRASQRDRRHVSRGLARGAPTPWDYEPRVDPSMQYVRARADLYELQRQARMEEPGGAIHGLSAADEIGG